MRALPIRTLIATDRMTNAAGIRTFIPRVTEIAFIHWIQRLPDLPFTEPLCTRQTNLRPTAFGHPRALWKLDPKEIFVIQQDAVVAIYDTHVGAEEAVKKLQGRGIDMRTLSIIGKDTHTDEHAVGYYNTGDRMKYWGKIGAFWGGFWGLLFGSAFFAIPGIGPVLAAGPVVAWIVAALENAAVVGGMSAVGAGLYSIGIPKDSIVQYETAIKTDKFVVMVHGSASEVDKAREVLEGTRSVSVTVHSKELAGAGAR